MAGSTADTPATPGSLRASDAERDQAVSKLRSEFAEGRLSHETFLHRMHSALDARSRGQLEGLFTDLPPRRPAPFRPASLLAGIRAVLRGAGPAGPGRAPGSQELPAAGYQPPWPVPLTFPPGRGVRFTIGRTRDCDLCLTDLSVSRTHALLVRREDGWVLSDLGSHNGTRLNGWLVREPVAVRAGDRVEFGSMAFILQEERPALPGEPPGRAGEGSATG